MFFAFGSSCSAVANGLKASSEAQDLLFSCWLLPTSASTHRCPGRLGTSHPSGKGRGTVALAHPQRGLTASGGAGAISQLLRTTSAVSTERKSFGIEIGKGELVPCSTGHSMMLRALDLVRRAASQMQPLLNLPAWALERHYTRCRPPRLYPKSFTAKTPTLHPGLGARTWPQSSSLPTKSCFRTWERGHWRCHIPKCVSALLLLLQLRNCDFEPGKES